MNERESGPTDGSRERWEQVEDLFHRALEREPGEREALLAAVGTDDPEVAREVADLLDAHLREGPVDRLADGLRVRLQPARHGSGDRIGPYRILRQLGSGGMGEVYLAEREGEGFRQRVALKVVGARGSGEELRRRFLRERRILAGLQHPNIARLLDGGVTEDGRPYLAMEYVEGVPIDRYCDDARLSVRDRLALFRSVCRAVQYAHRNLVVHRDLKPGNILVTSDGEPKLLDFGIAKLLRDGDGGTTTLTRTGGLPLTPEYASPEQVKGEPVTTASDVYALGVLLYELLAGHRPHRLRRKPPAEIERLVCETDPEPPSAAVGRMEQAEAGEGEAPRVTPETVSRARNTHPERLKRRLAGDLDTIVLKALRKEPERRYASAAQLADDIRRHLDGLPVRARPDTLAYRASKFVRRHSVGTAVAATIVLALIGFATAMAVQADRIARERDRAERVSDLLSDVFASADPTVMPGEELTVREALDRAVERLREGLEADPEVQARLLDVIAIAYRNLGARDRAIELTAEALAMLRSAVSPQHPLRLRALRNLGTWKTEVGEAEEAEALLSEALEVARRLGPHRAGELAEVLNDVGYARQVAGDPAAARPLYEEALAITRALPDPRPRVAATVETTLANLGWIAESRGDLETAESRFREALERRRARLGTDHPLAARSMLALSGVLRRRERPEEAEPLAAAALAIVRANYPRGHPEMAEALAVNAGLLAARGRHDEAEALQREALATYREAYGDRHLTVARATNDLAGYLRGQGETRLDEAVALYRRAAGRYAAVLGEAHPFTAVVRANVAWTDHLRGRAAEAEATYRRAVPVLDSAWAGTPAIAKTLVDFAVVLREREKSAEAEPLLRRALDLERGEWPAEHERVIRAQRQLGACLVDLRRFEEAEPLLLDAHRTLLERRGATHPNTIDAAGDLVRLYERWGKDDLVDEYTDASGGA